MTQPNPTPTDALRDQARKVAEQVWREKWAQAKKPKSEGGSLTMVPHFRDLTDAIADAILALLSPPDAAVRQALEDVLTSWKRAHMRELRLEDMSAMQKDDLFECLPVIVAARQALATPAPAIKEALCEWRPIAEWDEMKPKDRPQRALFWFKASESGGARLAPTIKEGRFYGYRECTHFMPIEPPTQGGEADG